MKWKDLLGRKGLDQDCFATCETAEVCFLEGCQARKFKGDQRAQRLNKELLESFERNAKKKTRRPR